MLGRLHPSQIRPVRAVFAGFPSFFIAALDKYYTCSYNSTTPVVLNTESPMSDTHLSALQMRIMRVLWARGEATAAEVHEALLEDRDLAPTTVATVLARLAKKNVVAYRKDGRQYVYHADVSEQAVRQSMVGELVERVFGGNRLALVNHLLKADDIAPAEWETLRRLVEDAPDAVSPANEDSDDD